MGWFLSQVIHPSWTLLVLSRWKRVFLEPAAAALWLRTLIREDEPKIQKQVRLDVLNLTSAKCFICPNETTESFIANWVTQMVSPAGFDTPPGCEWSWCPECPEWPESTECPEGPWPCASWASMSAIFDRKKASSLCGSVSHECSAFCWPPWHSQNCWLFHQKWVKGSEVHKEPWEGFAVFWAEHIVICLTLNDKYMFQDGINKSVANATSFMLISDCLWNLLQQLKPRAAEEQNDVTVPIIRGNPWAYISPTLAQRNCDKTPEYHNDTWGYCLTSTYKICCPLAGTSPNAT